MADESNTATDGGRKDGFVKGLSKAVARKALVPLAASAATAGTTFLTKKSSELWQEKVLPKVREKGGARAVAKEALERASARLGGRRGSGALSALAERLGTDGGAQPSTPERQEEPETSDDGREEERRERRRRRQQRQRALEQSESS